MMKREINEECGVIAVYNVKDAATLAYYGLHSLQHRGQEGAGIVTHQGAEFHRIKGNGLVSEVFNNENILSLFGDCALGHVRYSSATGRGIENVQPFYFKHSTGDFALAHNGNIVNAKAIRTYLEQSGTIFQSTSTGEILAHLLKRERHKNQHNAIMQALNILEGAFAFVIMTKEGMYAARDRQGLRPLCLGKLRDGYIFASESCALDIIGAEFIRDIQPGELVAIENSKVTSHFFAPNGINRICSMEYIYFARPDSNIDNINVHAARKRTGIILAEEHPADADIVIGIPDSSISAAVGYSEKTKIPYEMGLVKNKYIGRTFIQPSQELREKGVRMKLSAVSALVKNKNVVLIDDSIVRGTTIRQIVNLIKNAGANKVHIRIASPPMKYLCFYGVDTQTYDDLVSSRKTNEELRKMINADSLEFISEQGLRKAIGHETCCMACFNKDYPTPVYQDNKE